METIEIRTEEAKAEEATAEVKEAAIPTPLPETPAEADAEEVELEMPAIINGATKLQRELYELADSLPAEHKLAAVQHFTKIFAFLTEKCEENPIFNAKIMQPHKTVKRLYGYLIPKAKNYCLQNVAIIADEEVFKWVEEYYLKDDLKEIEEEERKKKEAAEKKATKKTAKKKTSTKKKASTKKAKTEESEEAKVEESKVEKETEATPETTSETKEEVQAPVEEPVVKEPDPHLKESVETPELTADEDGQFDIFSLL